MKGLREQNHPHSQKSKHQRRIFPGEPDIEIRSLIYVRSDLSKLHTRDRYLVIGKEGQWIFAKMFVGPQLRNYTYKLKASECIKVPTMIESNPSPLTRTNYDDNSDSDKGEPEDTFPPAAQPNVLLPDLHDAPVVPPEEILPAPTPSTPPRPTCADEPVVQPLELLHAQSPVRTCVDEPRVQTTLLDALAPAIRPEHAPTGTVPEAPHNVHVHVLEDPTQTGPHQRCSTSIKGPNVRLREYVT